MRKFMILLFISAFLGQPLASAAAHLCNDSGSVHLCEDACPAEAPDSEKGHAEDEKHHCCAASSFAVAASLPAEPSIPLRSAGLQAEKATRYSNPARDVFHPPA
jgi:hypothetical protein